MVFISSFFLRVRAIISFIPTVNKKLLSILLLLLLILWFAVFRLNRWFLLAHSS